MNEEQQQQKFEAWGLLELFGHQRLAGRLSEQTIGGVHFIRIDVPAVGDVQEYTRFFTQGAIYGMTITSEEVARRLAAGLRARPVNPWDMPQAPALPGSSRVEPDDRLYVVAWGRVRGYAPVTRLARTERGWAICRRGDAVAVTIDEPIKGFQGWRRRWWKRELERPFPDWKTAGVLRGR